jgi:hypothetical protein
MISSETAGSNGEMVFRLSPFRIISDNPTRQRRWRSLLKIDDSKKIAYKLSPLKLLGQWAQTIVKWSLMAPFRIVSGEPMQTCMRDCRHQQT